MQAHTKGMETLKTRIKPLQMNADKKHKLIHVWINKITFEIAKNSLF